jgi:cardiolipin synthase A/B
MPQPLPFIANAPYPVRANNSVGFWVDGQAAFTRLCEAIETAQDSIYATITFMWAAFRMPNGETALELLSRAAARGVDVRLIFWRPDQSTAALRTNAFWGAPEHFVQLLEHPKLSIRWDCAASGYCQHQKTWLIDKKQAFLGGLNLNPNSVVASGHFGEALNGAAQNHDLYIELEGDAVTDVLHNFIERWNFASERHKPDGSWGAQSDIETAKVRLLGYGQAMVQIQRTMPNRDMPGGEQTIFAQYLVAIDAAKRSIYLEHQYLEQPQIVNALHRALERGVSVLAVLPIVPDVNPTPERQNFLQSRARLGLFENFTLVGIAGLGADGRRKPVWIHSKLMLIDDAWVLVGSANLHRFSLLGNAELNAAIDSPEFAKALRVALFLEHLASDTSELGDVAAMLEFGQIAQHNRSLHLGGNPNWQGLAVALNVAGYGMVQPEGW